MIFLKKIISGFIGKIKYLIVKMLYAVVIVILIFIFTIACLLTFIKFSSEAWSFSLLLFVTSKLLYLLKIKLIKYYKKKKTQDLASKEEAFPGIQKQKLNAGVRIVPKWVSVFSLLPSLTLIAAVLALIVAVAPLIPFLLKLLKLFRL